MGTNQAHQPMQPRPGLARGPHHLERVVVALAQKREELGRLKLGVQLHLRFVERRPDVRILHKQRVQVLVQQPRLAAQLVHDGRNLAREAATMPAQKEREGGKKMLAPADRRRGSPPCRGRRPYRDLVNVFDQHAHGRVRVVVRRRRQRARRLGLGGRRLAALIELHQQHDLVADRVEQVVLQPGRGPQKQTGRAPRRGLFSPPGLGWSLKGRSQQRRNALPCE